MRKKTYICNLLLIVIISCCLAACGEEKTIIPTVVWSEANENTDSINNKTDTDEVETIIETNNIYDQQIQAFLDNSQWLSYCDMVNYAFCDLDANGRMEVIVCEKDADGGTAPIKIYEVSEHFDALQQCSFETNCYIYAIEDSTCEGAYIDPETGGRSYLMRYDEEYEGKMLFYYYELVLDKGHISEYAVCSENPIGIYNSRFERIDDETFNLQEEIDGYFAGKIADNIPEFLFDPLEGDGLRSKISESINTFIN